MIRSLIFALLVTISPAMAEPVCAPLAYAEQWVEAQGGEVLSVAVHVPFTSGGGLLIYRLGDNVRVMVMEDKCVAPVAISVGKYVAETGV